MIPSKYVAFISLLMVLVSGDSLGKNDPYKKKEPSKINLKAKTQKGGSSNVIFDDGRESPTWRPDPTYKYKYSLIKNEVIYTNDQWDAASNRTVLPLYAYYMRENMKFEVGYDSETYGKTYYDGYGYNYYYGGYGYYEFAINDRNPEENIPFAILFGVVFMFCFIGSAKIVNNSNLQKREQE